MTTDSNHVTKLISSGNLFFSHWNCAMSCVNQRNVLLNLFFFLYTQEGIKKIDKLDKTIELSLLSIYRVCV